MKEIQIDMDELVKTTYFKIASWYNNEEGLDADQMKNRLIGVSSDIIEIILEKTFADQKKGIRSQNDKVQDNGMLSGLNINLDNIKSGKK
jgi:hypothetical protein|tara:strand:+ start:13549 stop:13818 length:270 start_codon:yes stop_codon:yes gene_type:complete